MATKRCIKCGEDKTVDMFYLDKSKNWRFTICKACQLIYQQGKRAIAKSTAKHQKHLAAIKKRRERARNTKTRLCRLCKIRKPITLYKFYQGHYRKWRCISCERKRYRGYWDAMPKAKKSAINKRNIGYNRTSRSTPAKWPKYSMCCLRKKCKKRGIPLNIDASYIASIMPSDLMCPVLKKPFVFGPPSQYNPSLDRIIPHDGYTKGNIAIISVRANAMKQNATPEELAALARWAKKVTTASAQASY